MENNENKVEDTSGAVAVEKTIKSRRSSKSDDKSGVVAIGVDKTVLGFLAFSILINVFLVMHTNSLSGQVSMLTNIVSNSNYGSKVVVSTPTTTANSAQVVTTTSAGGKINLVVVTDSRCKTCDVSGLLTSLTQLFGPSLDYKVYDYADVQGKDIIESSGAKLLPAALFDDAVKTSPSYSQVSRYLTPAGKYLSLAIGADFDPTAEICDNKIDDNKDGKIDCEDITCKDSTLCRELIPKKLDVFVMSQCPYGIQALNSMKDVLTTLKDVKFDVHYIADEVNGVFNSLHGQGEVDEDIRQLCIKKYYPDTFMNYIWCRNANIQADWKTCIAGFDLSKIETCSTGSEGKALLSDDIKIATGLKISASPTFLSNNRVPFNAISPEDIKTSICGQNSGLVGCGTTLNSTTATPAGSCDPTP